MTHGLYPACKELTCSLGALVQPLPPTCFLLLQQLGSLGSLSLFWFLVPASTPGSWAMGRHVAKEQLGYLCSRGARLLMMHTWAKERLCSCLSTCKQGNQAAPAICTARESQAAYAICVVGQSRIDCRESQFAYGTQENWAAWTAYMMQDGRRERVESFTLYGQWNGGSWDAFAAVGTCCPEVGLPWPKAIAYLE